MDVNHLRQAIKRDGQPQIVNYDTARGLTLAWWGGHGIHAYNTETGQEMSFWNTGSFEFNDATPDQVKDSMENRIASGEYP